MDFKITSPQNRNELLQSIARLQGSKFCFGAGYTDLLLLLKKQPVEDLTVINLAGLEDKQFRSIEMQDGGIRIGALVTANMLTEDAEIKERLPVFFEAASHHASRQIRQVATVGGNLCTASPAGDLACALVALQAQCEILSARGTVRTVPLDKFFVDVRKTDLRPDEVLSSVFIPLRNESNKIHSNFIKIGIRRSMECAVVSLACHIHVDAEDRITEVGIAIGSAAPVIKFVNAAREFLLGKRFSQMNSQTAAEFAEIVVSYASPITDIRGSAWYRKEVLYNISKSLFENPSGAPSAIGTPGRKITGKK